VSRASVLYGFVRAGQRKTVSRQEGGGDGETLGCPTGRREAIVNDCDERGHSLNPEGFLTSSRAHTPVMWGKGSRNEPKNLVEGTIGKKAEALCKLENYRINAGLLA